jgi:hypothetical protein
MPFFSGGAALRGGNWNNGTNAGAFTLNLNNDPSNTNTNIGFRCSCLRYQTWEKYKCRKSIGKLVGHFSQILRPQGTSILFQGQPLNFNIQWSPKFLILMETRFEFCHHFLNRVKWLRIFPCFNLFISSRLRLTLRK